MTTPRSRLAVCAAALAAALMLGPACAQYVGCDGYGEATSEGDGMTEYATFLFIFSPPGYGNTDKQATQGGQAGISQCDAALADLPAKHWMRKVSLLRARALHRLDLADAAAALADLDLATAAANGSTDPYYVRSLGWGLDMVRAYALRRSGDTEKATALAMQLLAQRPYNRLTGYSALLALGPGVGEAERNTIQEALARLIPAYVDTLFLRAFESGRFADAIKLYSQLTPAEEIGDLNIYGGDRAARAWRDFRNARLFWASRGGAYAFALAATGAKDQARAAIADARARLAADTQPPPPLSEKDAKSAEKVAIHQGDIDVRQRAAADGAKAIDLWETLVDLRLRVAEAPVEDFAKELKSKPLPRSWASVDILDALEARLPSKQKPAVPLSQALRTELAKSQHDGRDAKPDAFFRSLPEAETPRRIPDYSEASRPWFGGTDDSVSGEGYRVGKTNEFGVTAVRFRGDQTSPSAVIEEMALLRAADAARAAGKKGLIVVRREDIHTTVTTTYYGTPLRTDPGGFETALWVVFVDPANLPERFKDAAWRVIDADAAYEALAPLYIKPKKR